MKKSNDKIIRFPIWNKVQRQMEKRKDCKRQIRLFLCSAFSTILCPAFTSIIVNILQIILGRTIMTESYIMPYWYSRDGYVANFSVTDDFYFQNTVTTPTNYEKACTIRTFFDCNKKYGSQLTNSSLRIYDVYQYEFAYMIYAAYALDDQIFIYGVNCGNGNLKAVTFDFSAKILSNKSGDINQVSWSNVDESFSQAADYLPIYVDEINGGDGIFMYSFDVSQYAFNEMYDGNVLALYVHNPLNTSNDEELVEMFRIDNGKIVPYGVGGGDANTNRYYAYINVDNDNHKEIPVYSAFTIENKAAVDITVIPSESCIIDFSMIYTIDGRDIETEIFTSQIHVPIYETFLARDIMEYMHDNSIQYYRYGITNPRLDEKVKYDPLSIKESLE